MPDTTTITAEGLGLDLSFDMPSRPHRIGMVGFGGIARHAHAPAYRAMGWPMVAAADPDPSARGCAREQFGIERLYDDWRELVADSEVEVVDLLTHPTIRSEVVEAAAAHGKPLVTEKPFATTIDEAERMVAVAENAGTALAVHQNYRWMPTNYVAQRLVGAGWIGTPFFANIEIYGTQDRHLAEHPFYSTCTDFLTLQWNNHLADLLRYWVGRDPRRVFARTGRMAEQRFTSDNLLISVHDFGPGATGHILHHELLRSDMQAQPCRIDGDNGSIVFDLWGDRLTLQSVRLGGGPQAMMVNELGLPSSFAGSMGDFLAAVEAGSEPSVSGRRNLTTIRAILGEHASASRGGEWVEVG